MSVHSCHLLFDHFQFTLIHGPNIPDSYATLLFTALEFTSIMSDVHNWALFLLWLCLFILFGVVSPLFSSSILGNYQPGDFIFQCPIFLPFHTVHGVLKARILVCHSLLQWTKFCKNYPAWSILGPSWGALHSMAHSFIELDKAVAHVIRLVSFPWLWFSFCVSSDGEG